jgi:hypothetical protein
MRWSTRVVLSVITRVLIDCRQLQICFLHLGTWYLITYLQLKIIHHVQIVLLVNNLLQ